MTKKDLWITRGICCTAFGVVGYAWYYSKAIKEAKAAVNDAINKAFNNEEVVDTTGKTVEE